MAPVALPTDADIAAPVVKRDGDGKLTVDVNTADVDDVYAGGETTAGSGDWNSVMLTRTDDTSKAADTVVIYTDIEAPKATMLTAERTAGAVTMIGTDNSVNTRGNAFGTIVEQFGRIMPNDLPPNDEVALNYVKDATFMGTYRGIPGEYTCTSNGCSIGLDAKGKVDIASGNTFTFVPTDQGATYDAPDTAYAYFGWWLNKPVKEDGTHMVEVFAGGTMGHEFLGGQHYRTCGKGDV